METSQLSPYRCYHCTFHGYFESVIVLLATASKTNIGSVLFRTSAYTGAKQASRVPTGSKQDNSPHSDDVKDVSAHLALFSLRTESDNPDATCELSP